MDLVIENVGRRSSRWGGVGDPTDIGDASLNGRERNALFWNRDGRFEDVGFFANAARSEDGRGVAVADFDRDGRLDLALQNLDKPAVLLMGRGRGGRWLQASLVGTKSPRDAVGAVAIAHVGGRRITRQVAAGHGFVSSASRVLHFGLGAAERVDRLEIRWPSGERTELRDVAVDRRIEIVEGEARAVAVAR